MVLKIFICIKFPLFRKSCGEKTKEKKDNYEAFCFSSTRNNSTAILQGHVDKPSNDYDVDKMIKEKNDSFNQLNLDDDLSTRNTLPTLAPKQNDIKIYGEMNESVGSSSNRTKITASGLEPGTT